MPPSAPGPDPAPPSPRLRGGASQLDPALRQRLLTEARTPWRTLRRGLWFALTASAALGLATMTMRFSAGEAVPSDDLLIQITALFICGGLLWFDRNRHPVD